MGDKPVLARASVQTRRPRIYALLGDLPRLEPIRGDQMDEARFLTVLSNFADVYYNGQLFRPDAPDWGLNATTVAPPGKDYDLYYVRDNAPVFLSCPSPRMTLARPYDPGVFYSADALLVTGEVWKAGLEAGAAHRPSPLKQWYAGLQGPLPRLINIQQAVGPGFCRFPGTREITAAKARMSFGRIIGYFGDVEEASYPEILTGAYREVRRFLPDLQMVIAGDMHMSHPNGVLNIPPVPYAKVPGFLKACIATASDEGETAAVLPSSRIAESIAAGTPVLAYRTNAHVEQLGDDYPLYYHDHGTAARRLLEVVFDRDLVGDVRKQLTHRAKQLEPAVRAKTLKTEIEALLLAAQTSA